MVDSNEREDAAAGVASSRSAIFWIEIAYLFLLAVSVVGYLGQWVTHPASIGPIPIAVPWFGALGAVIISLWGVTEHRDDWDGRWKYWHWSRPFVGASLAVVSVLILKAGILAVGSVPSENQGATSNLLYYVVAFLIGYREETFRDLVQKVVDTILTPGSSPAEFAVSSLVPLTGPLAGGTTVTITGVGLTGVRSVDFGAASATFSVKSRTLIEATSPPAERPETVKVIVQAPDGRAVVRNFTYTE